MDVRYHASGAIGNFANVHCRLRTITRLITRLINNKNVLEQSDRSSVSAQNKYTPRIDDCLSTSDSNASKILEDFDRASSRETLAWRDPCQSDGSIKRSHFTAYLRSSFSAYVTVARIRVVSRPVSARYAIIVAYHAVSQRYANSGSTRLSRTSSRDESSFARAETFRSETRE